MVITSALTVPCAPAPSAFRYVIGELLGTGGTAEVFSGHVNGVHGFQKPVAIKRLLPELASDGAFVDRLIAEAKLLVRIQHGNIVGVLDLARDDTHVFVVMDYVDGPTLRQLLAACGDQRLPLGVATYIVQAAATGLEFAHAQPDGAIIHADISPSNLLLATSGEVRVADFGIARREGNASGIVEGKWAYMAPEQTRGDPLTPASDVFALGVVLYELITGRRPFGEPTTACERGEGPLHIVRPRVVDPTVPPGLDSICMRALADDPRDRYSRMQHMVDALVDERFLNHWRDGANELAQLIRELPASDRDDHQRTLFTERPVTLMTRSLIVPAAPPADLELSDAHTVIVEMPAAPVPVRLPRGSSPELMAVADPSRPRRGDAKRNPQRLFAMLHVRDHAAPHAPDRGVWTRLGELRVAQLAGLLACSMVVGMIAAAVKFACSQSTPEGPVLSPPPIVEPGPATFFEAIAPEPRPETDVAPAALGRMLMELRACLTTARGCHRAVAR